MSIRIRKAKAPDAAQLLAIKDQLPMRLAEDSTSAGGFLLGTDEATYRKYIATAHTIVAEAAGRVVGFAIVLPDAELRQSEIWQKRHIASWNIPLDNYESQRLCYFEQFAFLPGYRRTAVAAAYLAAALAFEEGYTSMFATTVSKPVLNLAAVPFITAAGGIHAGSADEYYPVVGQINSDIWVLECETFKQRIDAHPLAGFFKGQTIMA